MPALLKRTSSRPNVSLAAAKRLRMAATSETSVGTTSARAAATLASATVASSASLRRPARATEYPSWKNARATALPTPLPAPVTRAILAMASPLEAELLEGVAVRGGETAADREGPRHLAHVDVAARVDGDPVGSREASRRGRLQGAPAREQAALLVVHAHPARARLGDRSVSLGFHPGVPPQLGHVGTALGVEHDVGRALRVGPLAEVLAVGTEDLDPIVLAVTDEHPSVRCHRDPVGKEELPRAAARHAPGALPLTARRELMNLAVAVAVGDVQVALRPHGQVGRPVERSAGSRHRAGVLTVVAGIRGFIHGAQREQQLALGRELAHGVIAVVGAVQHLVRPHRDAVGAVGELTLPPRAQELALLVVDDDRMIAAADQEHAILAIDGDPGHVAVDVPGRKLLPALDDLVASRLLQCHGCPLQGGCGWADYRGNGRTSQDAVASAYPPASPTTTRS